MDANLNFHDSSTKGSEVRSGSDQVSTSLFASAYDGQTANKGTLPDSALKIITSGFNNTIIYKTAYTGAGESLPTDAQKALDTLLRNAERAGHPIQDPIHQEGISPNSAPFKPVKQHVPQDGKTKTDAGAKPDKATDSVNTNQIGKDWDTEYTDQNKMNGELKTAALDAYKTGGADGLKVLQDQLNAKIKTDGAGAAIVLNDGKIEIHNVQSYTAAESAKLPVEQQKGLTDLNTVDGIVRVKELTPVMTVDTKAAGANSSGDTNPGTSDKPASVDKIAKDWDTAYNDQSKVSKELKDAALNAFSKNGERGLKDLQENLNKVIVADNAGPVFSMNNGNIDIHNVKGSNAEAGAGSRAEKPSVIQSVAGEIRGVELTPITEIQPPTKKAATNNLDEHKQNFAALFERMDREMALAVRT